MPGQQQHLFIAAMNRAVQVNMDQFSAEEALHSQCAYYKDEMKYFVGSVTKQVVERHLVKPLPDRVLSPMVVGAMTDDEVALVAGEPKETTRRRAELEAKVKMLEAGQATFRRAMM